MPKEAEACTGLVRHDGVDVGRDPDSILTFIVDPQQARFTLDTFYRFWYILSTFDARVLWFLTGVRHLRSVGYLLPLFNKKQQQYMGYWALATSFTYFVLQFKYWVLLGLLYSGYRTTITQCVKNIGTVDTELQYYTVNTDGYISGNYKPLLQYCLAYFIRRVGY